MLRSAVSDREDTLVGGKMYKFTTHGLERC